MKRRAFAPKPTLRGALEDSNKWDRYYAMSAGLQPVGQSEIPEKRVIKNHSDKEELEGSVLREVGKAILLAPNVILSWRQNGGAAPAADGVFRIWYYRWIKRPQKNMTLVDFICVLKSGMLAALECKRRDWHYTGTEREQAQKAFIDRIVASGGRGGFVTNAEQALAILK